MRGKDAKKMAKLFELANLPVEMQEDAKKASVIEAKLEERGAAIEELASLVARPASFGREFASAFVEAESKPATMKQTVSRLSGKIETAKKAARAKIEAKKAYVDALEKLSAEKADLGIEAEGLTSLKKFNQFTAGLAEEMVAERPTAVGSENDHLAQMMAYGRKRVRKARENAEAAEAKAIEEAKANAEALEIAILLAEVEREAKAEAWLEALEKEELEKIALAELMADGRIAAREAREAKGFDPDAYRIAEETAEKVLLGNVLKEIKAERVAERVNKFFGEERARKAAEESAEAGVEVAPKEGDVEKSEMIEALNNNYFGIKNRAADVLNALQYEWNHYVPTMEIEPPMITDEGKVIWKDAGKGIATKEVKYDRVSSSPLMKRIAFKKEKDKNKNVIQALRAENVIQDGRLLPVYDGDDNDIKRVITLAKGSGNLLHKNVVKVDFHDMAQLSESLERKFGERFENAVREASFFIDPDKGTIRKRVSDSERPEGGEKLFVFGGWTPSSEKGRTPLFVSFTEEIRGVFEAQRLAEIEVNEMLKELQKQAMNNINQESGDMLSGLPLANNTKLSARVCQHALAQGISIGDLLYSYGGGSVLVVNDEFDSVLEVQNKDAQEKLGIKTNAPDGGGYISSSFIATGLRNISGQLWMNVRAASVNIQCRISGLAGKIFAKAVLQKDLEFFAKRQTVGRTEGKDYLVLGNGPIRAIFDKNGLKFLGAKWDELVAGNLPKELDVLALAIPHTSEGVNFNSQLANKLSNTDNRDEIDEFLCEKVAENLLDRIAQRTGLATRPFLREKSQLFEVALASDMSMLNSTIFRKSVLKELDSAFSPIVDKAKVKLEGFYEHATCDASYALTRGIIDGILGIHKDKDGIPMIECYSQYAERKGIREGVIQKNPSQGTEEHLLVYFLTKEELFERIDGLAKKAIAENRCSKGAALRAGEAVRNTFVKHLGDGTILMPAFNIVKEMLAGMDYDYDAVSVFTEAKIVDAIKDKLRGCQKEIDGKLISVIGRACIIRYQKDLAATEKSKSLDEDRKLVNSKLSKGANKKIDSIFNNLKKVAKKEAGKALTGDYLLDLYHTAVAGVVFGSVIGKVVSAGDLATTLDDKVYFTDGVVNEAGMVAISQLFKCLGRCLVEGATYKSVFVDGKNKVDAVIGGIINDNVAVVESYIVSKETVMDFIRVLQFMDIRYLTLEDYQKMSFEFSFIVRALGESAIDMLKKGDEVSLGADMNDILASSPKLSKKIDCESNIDKVINYAVYKQGDEVLYKINLLGGGSAIGKDLVKGNFAEKIVKAEMEKLAEAKKEAEKKGKKCDHKVMLIDKVGITKIKLLATAEATVSTIASGFAGDFVDENGNREKVDVPTYNWYSSNVKKVYSNFIDRVAHTRKISPVKAEEQMQESMMKISKLLSCARASLFDAAFSKELKTELRYAIISVFESAFSDIENKALKDILAVSMIAYSSYYSFNGINANSKFARNKSFENIRVKERELNWRNIDSTASVLFKVFGSLVTFLFSNNPAKVELNVVERKDVTRHFSLKMKVMTQIEDAIDFDYDDDLDCYGLFLKDYEDEEYFATFGIPEGFEDLMDNIADIHVEVDRNGRRRIYTSFEPSFSDIRAKHGAYSIVVLDKVMSGKEPVVVEYSIASASKVLEREFAGSGSYTVDSEFAADKKASVISSLCGKEIHMPFYSSADDTSKLLHNREVEISGSGEIIGTSLVGSNEVKGTIVAAFDNVLVVKNN